MKRIVLVISIILCLLTGQSKAQFIFNFSPPTCSTCCDGTITVTQTLCPYGFALGGFSPTLTLISAIGNTLVYKGACCRTYTMYIGNVHKECEQPPYIGVANVPCMGTSIPTTSTNIKPIFAYPNPVKERFYLDMAGIKKIVLTDLVGEIAKMVLTESNEIEIADLANGIYLLTVYSEKGILVTRQKLVLE